MEPYSRMASPLWIDALHGGLRAHAHGTRTSRLPHCIAVSWLSRQMVHCALSCTPTSLLPHNVAFYAFCLNFMTGRTDIRRDISIMQPGTYSNQNRDLHLKGIFIRRDRRWQLPACMYVRPSCIQCGGSYKQAGR